MMKKGNDGSEMITNEGGCEGGAGGADTGDVAVRGGEVGGEGGAEVGGVDEEVVG